jgi:phosphatidylglycerophosphate synthase
VTVAPENASPPVVAAPGSSRPVQEVAVSAFFAPLATVLVRALLPARISPPVLVLVHTAVGLAAARLVADGALVAAALVLQLKTLLDNADGRLARASGRVTLVGRYLDTEADFVVNAALFAAIGFLAGELVLAVVAFVALTVVLSVDFNVSILFAGAHGLGGEDAARSGSRVEGALERAYGIVFAPQDRLVRLVAERRLERVLGGEEDEGRIARATLAYHDRGTAAVLANLGLSTQLLALGVLLVLGAPEAYLVLVVASLALLPVLQLRRERRARSALVR